MAFAANPLSLSVPEAAFETWLRDSGYLEVLDERATFAAADPSPPPSDLLVHHPTASPGGGDGNPSSAAASSASRHGGCVRYSPAGCVRYVGRSRSRSRCSLFLSFIGFVRTLLSLLTLNPFAKLSTEDFSAPMPSWTLEFIGTVSYSWPAGPSQAKMRVQENVRRYAWNYAYLWCLIFACTLYKMPFALLGLILSMFLWELLRFCSARWGLEEDHPGIRQALVRILQIASAVVMYLCNIQLAVVCATGVSYAVMLFHASLRKLTPSKQSNNQRRFQPKRLFSTK